MKSDIFYEIFLTGIQGKMTEMGLSSSVETPKFLYERGGSEYYDFMPKVGGHYYSVSQYLKIGKNLKFYKVIIRADGKSLKYLELGSGEQIPILDTNDLLGKIENFYRQDVLEELLKNI